MRIGILTGGGDCPGLNAVIRAVVRKGEGQYGHEVIGFLHGWRGVMENDSIPLTIAGTRGILARGGTVLLSSRTNPFKSEGGEVSVRRTLDEMSIDALIAIGGEDTLGVAARLADAGIRVVGVPKTIDNDLSATDVTFGFDTAVQTATEAIDRLRTTAESHDRVMVVEVMGRHAGWIALHSGMAGGADVILIPERPFDIDEVVAYLTRRHSAGRRASVIVVAEGAIPKAGTLETITGETDDFGHARLGGIGNRLTEEIERRTGWETRATILVHVIRGGTPTANDRLLATRFGLAAIDAVQAGDFGSMVALRGTEIVRVPLAEAVATLKTVPEERYAEAEVFFG